MSRFLVGFGVGGIAVPFDLLAEVTPTSHRGTFTMRYALHSVMLVLTVRPSTDSETALFPPPQHRVLLVDRLDGRHRPC
jgi:hypothetical protein